VLAALYEGEHGDAALPRLVELLLGRADAAADRLTVRGSEQQDDGVGCGDLVQQRAARSLVARGFALEHHRPHVERLDRRACSLPDGANVPAEQRADEDALHANRLGRGVDEALDAGAQRRVDRRGDRSLVQAG
jgi:hypothetical protein